MRPYLDAILGQPFQSLRRGAAGPRGGGAGAGTGRRLLGAEPGEIVFTAGGTEADNLALQGCCWPPDSPARHLITSAIEHPAILACCRQLERLGVAVTRLPVDGEGLIDPADLERALRPETRLVSIMAANNVIGTIQPIGELARIARAMACCSTPTPCKPWARSPSTCARSRSTCSRFPATSCTGPKASAPCLFAKASSCGRSCRAAARSEAAARARRTWPPSSGWAGRRNWPRLAGRRGRPARPHPRPPHGEHLRKDRQLLLDRPSLAPLARPYLPGFRRSGRRGDQAALGIGQGGHRHFVGQRVQPRSMPASPPMCWRPWDSMLSRPAARCGYRWDDSTRSRKPTGSWRSCPGPCFAAAHPAIGEGRITSTVLRKFDRDQGVFIHGNMRHSEA